MIRKIFRFPFQVGASVIVLGYSVVLYAMGFALNKVDDINKLVSFLMKEIWKK